MDLADGWWTARLATFAAIVAASALSSFSLAELSADALEESLDHALTDHLRGDANLMATAIAPEPLEAVAALGQGHGADALRQRLEGLAAAAGLHDSVLLGPDGLPLGRSLAEPWLAARADADLIRAARRAPTAGTLYRTGPGELFETAYAPVPGHPGFVLGIEGSGATLQAVDQLETLQLEVGIGVAALGAALGAVLAIGLSRPLSRLEGQVSALAPGGPADAITVQGPREVRRLARSVRALLAAIRDRDAALELSHAARLAEVTTLAAAVAHEVRNPVNALGIILGGLRTADRVERRDQLLDRAGGCVREIEATVDRFLDLSRPIRPRCVPSDLGALCAAVALEVEDRLVVEVSGEARTDTDPELLRQVLRNLLNNAAQAGAGHARVTVDASSIEVVDDGPGLDPTAVDQVFDWFYTTRAQGTGLGLPLSRRICRALGGDLVLVTGRPATFRIELP